MHRMRRALEGGAMSALFRLGIFTAVMIPASLMSADAELIPAEALSAG